MTINSWDDAMDALVDDATALWDALDNVVELWDVEAPMHEIEDAIARARHVRDTLRNYEITQHVTE